MARVDLKKESKSFYRASARAVGEVVVPPLKYLMVDGRGDPNTSAEYAQAGEALFSVSFTAKFAVKRRPPGIDYAVMRSKDGGGRTTWRFPRKGRRSSGCMRSSPPAAGRGESTTRFT